MYALGKKVEHKQGHQNELYHVAMLKHSPELAPYIEILLKGSNNKLVILLQSTLTMNVTCQFGCSTNLPLIYFSSNDPD